MATRKLATADAPIDGTAAAEGAPFTVRDIPSNDEISKAHADNLATQPKGRTFVRTVNPGSMWDPDQSQWIHDEGVAAKHSEWLQIQIDSGKIEVTED